MAMICLTLPINGSFEEIGCTLIDYTGNQDDWPLHCPHSLHDCIEICPLAVIKKRNPLNFADEFNAMWRFLNVSNALQNCSFRNLKKAGTVPKRPIHSHGHVHPSLYTA